jgi:hypothetical protein
MVQPNLSTGSISPETCVRWVKIAAHQLDLNMLALPSPYTTAYTYCQDHLLYFEKNVCGVLVSQRHIFLPTLDYICDSHATLEAIQLVKELLSIDQSEVIP